MVQAQGPQDDCCALPLLSGFRVLLAAELEEAVRSHHDLKKLGCMWTTGPLGARLHFTGQLDLGLQQQNANYCCLQKPDFGVFGEQARACLSGPSIVVPAPRNPRQSHPQNFVNPGRCAFLIRCQMGLMNPTVCVVEDQRVDHQFL